MPFEDLADASRLFRRADLDGDAAGAEAARRVARRLLGLPGLVGERLPGILGGQRIRFRVRQKPDALGSEATFDEIVASALRCAEAAEFCAYRIQAVTSCRVPAALEVLFGSSRTQVSRSAPVSAWHFVPLPDDVLPEALPPAAAGPWLDDPPLAPVDPLLPDCAHATLAKPTSAAVRAARITFNAMLTLLRLNSDRYEAMRRPASMACALRPRLHGSRDSQACRCSTVRSK